jgi:hypothetical protein
MHRLPDNGIVIGIYGGIGYYERGGARQSADCFAWARSLMRRLVSIFL